MLKIKLNITFAPVEKTIKMNSLYYAIFKDIYYFNFKNSNKPPCPVNICSIFYVNYRKD